MFQAYLLESAHDFVLQLLQIAVIVVHRFRFLLQDVLLVLRLIAGLRNFCGLHRCWGCRLSVCGAAPSQRGGFLYPRDAKGQSVPLCAGLKQTWHL